MLITISNRLPVSVVRREQSLHFESSVGGLATGLAQFVKEKPSAWVGWPGIPLSRIDDRERAGILERLKNESCHPVFLTGYEVENFYYGFANRTIWPLFHYFPLHTSYNKTFWAVYEKVNTKFADAVAEILRPGDTVWVHDYHLLLLPEMIRRRRPGASIGFFLHIPFPSFELFRLLPWREEILRGLLGADLVGFHTKSYSRHFLESVSTILGLEARQGKIRLGTRTVTAGAFPMGIDSKKFSTAGSLPRVRREVEKIERRCVDRKIILSVDRLDYTKGIPQRIEAYDLFLERNPEWREKVTFILIAVPSRTAVPAYAQLKKSVDESIGRISGRFGAIGWVPIWYLYRALPFETLAAYYRAADVCLVTPLRDGMNLVAKEYLASRDAGDGVLVLSEMAGAAEELGGSILVNPNNTDEIAEAIKEALSLGPKEQIRRNEPMRRRIEKNTVVRWAGDFLRELSRTRKATAG
jgi:trehalose 6-phosphate synthase/phosphatase